jgi:hypothetical protein
MSRFHEGKACDAVVRRIESRERSARENVRSPEREGDVAPVELTCSIGGQLFAIEHTGLEPFEGQIAIEAKHHLEPLRAKFLGKIPKGELWDLQIPARATLKFKESKIRQIVSVLEAWICSEGPRVSLAPLGQKGTPIDREADSSIPFKVQLYRSAIAGPGQFWTSHQVDQPENSRTARIERACRAKYPKLEKWKRRGARTVLVLEENDIQLTNAIEVCRSLLHVEKSLQFVPDEVYLVTTTLIPWEVWFLRVDTRTFFDLSDPNERAVEFDPQALLPLTAR